MSGGKVVNTKKPTMAGV